MDELAVVWHSQMQSLFGTFLVIDVGVNEEAQMKS
jgi:hypothetical protein